MQKDKRVQSRRGTVLLALGVVVLGTLAGPAGTAFADDSVITVCEGNDVSTVAPDGTALGDAELQEVIRQVERVCEPPTAARNASPLAASTYYNVVALITNSPGKMGINGYANSLPFGSYKVGCIYRVEPVSGTAGSWMSCGAITIVNNTYGSTSTVMFCPVPGTRFHARATLDTMSNGWLADDDAWAVAVY